LDAAPERERIMNNFHNLPNGIQEKVFDVLRLTPSNKPGAATPLPWTLPLFAGGAGMIALLARRRKRKQTA